MLFVIEVAAANLGLNKDLLAPGQDVNGDIANLKKAPYQRVIRRLGLTGSAAVEDFWVQVEVGGVPVAKLHNNIITAPVGWDKDAIVLLNPIPVPKDVELAVKVIDAGGTNNGYLVIEF